MKISVVICTYNRFNLVKRAIKSVLNQSLKPFEIILIDDGSSDETNRLQNDKNIRYFYKQNGGISSARNFGIKQARGEWIAFLDDDDEWDRDKLALQVNFHKKNNFLISYTNEKWVRDGKEVKLPKKFQKHSGDIFQKCLSHCFIAPSSVLMKRNLFDEFGYFDENLEVCEDYDLWIKIASKYPIGLINQPLIIKYAGHENQLGFKHWGMDRFRVKSLLNIYSLLTNKEQKDDVKHELILKIDLLIKGAKKHDRFDMLDYYLNLKENI